MKTKADFIWLKSDTETFERIKNAISNDCLLQLYDVSHPLLIECNAFKKGLGCTLLQPMDRNITDQDISDFSEKEIEEFVKHLRPVAYSNKSISDAETQYSNIERELLGIVVGIEHLKHFTFGRKTHIITDQKPLLPLFQKSLTNATSYLSRLFTFQSMMYNYIITLDPK